jgi:hypothetical protein
VVDVFIPEPWRHFAFVTFAEQRVAASLIGKEHNLKVATSRFFFAVASTGTGQLIFILPM